MNNIDKQKEFLSACKTGNLTIVTKTIEDIDVNFTDRNGKTALYYAVYENNIDIVKILLKNKASVEVLFDSDSILLFAVIQLLINNCTGKNGFNEGVWSSAMDESSTECIVALIENGVDVDLKNGHGFTAYDIAEKNKCIRVMYLFNKNIIDRQDENGDTLLMTALEKKDEDDILFLYEKTSDPYLENKDGVSFFDNLCVTKNLPSSLEALKEKLALQKEIELSDDIDFKVL